MPLFVGTRRTLRYAPTSAGAATSQTTWNSADKHASLTLSNGDRTATSSAGAPIYVRSVAGKSSGKWYAEVIGTFASAGNDDAVGVATSSQSLSAYVKGSDTTGIIKYLGFNQVAGNDNAATYGAASNSNDIIMIAVDFTNDKLWFGVNGTWYESGNPATNTGGLNMITGTVYLFAGPGISGDSVTIPAIQTYTPPSGFSVWS